MEVLLVDHAHNGYIFLSCHNDRCWQKQANDSIYEHDKKSHKWWTKVFFHLLMVSAVNAWVLHNDLHRQKTLFLTLSWPRFCHRKDWQNPPPHEKEEQRKAGHFKGQKPWERRPIYLFSIEILDTVVDVLSRKRRHKHRYLWCTTVQKLFCSLPEMNAWKFIGLYVNLVNAYIYST